ncbi:hypothetical protein ACFQZ4_54715 [Catellatospora coxensis]
MSTHHIRRSAAATAVAVGALAALTACGGGRAAASVSASQSGTVVTDSSDDLGSIIIGWENSTPTTRSPPKPEDVTADASATETTWPSRSAPPAGSSRPHTRRRC